MEYNEERPHSSLAHRTPAEFRQGLLGFTNRMGLTAPIPSEPPAAGEWSQSGTHGQGFANAAPKAGAPLTVPCRSRRGDSDGRFRRDGKRGAPGGASSCLRIKSRQVTSGRYVDEPTPAGVLVASASARPRYVDTARRYAAENWNVLLCLE